MSWSFLFQMVSVCVRPLGIQPLPRSAFRWAPPRPRALDRPAAQPIGAGLGPGWATPACWRQQRSGDRIGSPSFK